MTEPKPPTHPRTLANRLELLEKHARKGRLSERQRVYLDALLTHYYETTRSWTDE
ncbi:MULTISPECIES: hypothetical protein [Gordonia]|uniref:hypothetical protein n=1 Tax=Gordonia TaxID=2053 RepID=UPI0039E47ED3